MSTSQMRLQIMEGFPIQLRFFRNFSYITTCLKRHNFIKLLQTVCQGRSVEIHDYVSLVFRFIFLINRVAMISDKNEYFPKVLIFDYGMRKSIDKSG